MVVERRAQQADQPDELTGLGDGYEHRQHLLAECGLCLREDAAVVGPDVVELGDRDHARHPDVGTLPPERGRRMVDALIGRNDEQRTVGGAEAGAQLADEVRVPGCVDQVDLRTLMHQRGDRQ